MPSYSTQQRIEIVQLYYENGRSVKNVFRKLREIYGRHNRPSEPEIRNIVQKFEETGSVLDIKPATRKRKGRSQEHINMVRDSVAEDQQTSIARRSQQLEITQTTLWRILHKDLALKPYKVQLVQELQPLDHSQRRDFVNWMDEQEPQFSRKIFFSDEAHFQLNGYVNKQNCRIWGDENPHIVQEKPLHPQRVTVWCAFWYGGVIGPYFFENDDGRAVTINGNRYREIITYFFLA